MEEKIITPNKINTKREFKFKIAYDNGANETIFPKSAPTLDPNIPMFINFVIKAGTVRQINLSKVRTIDVDITESVDLTL